MSNKFIITEEQKEQLRQLLSKEEYNKVILKKWDDFFVELAGLVATRFENDEPTKESNALDRLYTQIYNQN